MNGSVAVADVPGAINTPRAGFFPLAEPCLLSVAAAFCLQLQVSQVCFHRCLAGRISGSGIVDHETSVVDWFEHRFGLFAWFNYTHPDAAAPRCRPVRKVSHALPIFHVGMPQVVFNVGICPRLLMHGVADVCRLVTIGNLFPLIEGRAGDEVVTSPHRLLCELST